MSRLISCLWSTAILLLHLKYSISQEQQIVCDCAPSSYKWSLDFSRTCPPNNITVGPETGISVDSCLIAAADADVTDLVPVVVNQVLIVEFDENLSQRNQFDIEDAQLVNGDDLVYVSAGKSKDFIPAGIQMRLFCSNANNDRMLMQWAIFYSNRCDVLPFEGGGRESLGFTVFVSTSEFIKHIFNTGFCFVFESTSESIK